MVAHSFIVVWLHHSIYFDMRALSLCVLSARPYVSNTHWTDYTVHMSVRASERLSTTSPATWHITAFIVVVAVVVWFETAQHFYGQCIRTLVICCTVLLAVFCFCLSSSQSLFDSFIGWCFRYWFVCFLCVEFCFFSSILSRLYSMRSLFITSYLFAYFVYCSQISVDHFYVLFLFAYWLLQCQSACRFNQCAYMHVCSWVILWNKRAVTNYTIHRCEWSENRWKNIVSHDLFVKECWKANVMHFKHGPISADV